MTYWTQSGRGENHGSTVPIVVEEIFKSTAGVEILRIRAELGEVGEREYAFIFKVTFRRMFQLRNKLTMQLTSVLCLMSTCCPLCACKA